MTRRHKESLPLRRQIALTRVSSFCFLLLGVATPRFLSVPAMTVPESLKSFPSSFRFRGMSMGPSVVFLPRSGWVLYGIASPILSAFVLVFFPVPSHRLPSPP